MNSCGCLPFICVQHEQGFDRKQDLNVLETDCICCPEATELLHHAQAPPKHPGKRSELWRMTNALQCQQALGFCLGNELGVCRRHARPPLSKGCTSRAPGDGPWWDVSAPCCKAQGQRFGAQVQKLRSLPSFMLAEAGRTRLSMHSPQGRRKSLHVVLQ